jgi:hypothetical protein
MGTGQAPDRLNWSLVICGKAETMRDRLAVQEFNGGSECNLSWAIWGPHTTVQ